MGLRINQNIAALNAHRQLTTADSHLARSLEKLSSGLRINKASDDATGLSISEKLRANVRGLTQAVRNAQEAVSMIQTAEGALNEVTAIVQRMRELTVQAGNSTLSSADRTSIGDELVALRQEVDRIGTSTKFNGLALLTGSLTVSQNTAAPSSIVVGTYVGGGAGDATVSSVDLSGAAAGSTYTFTYAAATDTLTLSDGTNSQNVLLDPTIGSDGILNINFSSLGINLQITGESATTADNIGAALSGTDGQGLNRIATSAGTGSASFQVGAFSGETISVAFGDMRSTALGSGAGNQLSDKIADNTAVSTTTLASALLTTLDDALEDVTSQRAFLGASQNRIEHTIASLSVAVENLAFSESRVRDVDMAREMVTLTRSQILLQAGTAMLAQANQAPQVVLNLLR